MIRAYGKSWHIIDPTVIPLTIFFNFHASIILIKLKDGHYWHKKDGHKKDESPKCRRNTY